jgi:hypothetical protein
MNEPSARPSLPARRLAPWVLVVAGLVLTLYLTAFAHGQLVNGMQFLHDFMHDGRHVLGVPCH